MPAMVGMGLPRVSELVVDADINIPVAYKLITAKIQAQVGGPLGFYTNGGWPKAYVGTDGLVVDGGATLFTDHVSEVTASHRTVFNHGIKTDTIDDNGAAEIGILENICARPTKYVRASKASFNAFYYEDGASAAPFPAGIKVDHIAEYTSAHGIVFDDTVTLDSLITLLTQRWRTAAAGATSRYASDAEVFIANPGATPTQIKSSVAVPDWYAGATNTFTITFDGHSSAVSSGDEMYITVNDVEVGTRLPLSSPGYSTKNQDIGMLETGDVIKIMCVDTVGTGGNLYCRNFRISSTDTVSLPITTETW